MALPSRLSMPITMVLIPATPGLQPMKRLYLLLASYFSVSRNPRSKSRSYAVSESSCSVDNRVYNTLLLGSMQHRASKHFMGQGVLCTYLPDTLPFKEETFDLIWSEGAIYNTCFEKGLNEWKKFIKRNGYITVTDSTWLTDSRLKEIEDFCNS